MPQPRRSGGDRPVGALGLLVRRGRQKRDCPKMISSNTDFGQRTAEGGQCGNTARMTDSAIIVHVGKRAFGRFLVIFSVMLVVVMTEVLRRSRFVLAIGRCHRPGNLERQDNQQENGEPATHGVNSNRTEVCSKTKSTEEIAPDGKLMMTSASLVIIRWATHPSLASR